MLKVKLYCLDASSDLTRITKACCTVIATSCNSLAEGDEKQVSPSLSLSFLVYEDKSFFVFAVCASVLKLIYHLLFISFNYALHDSI